MRAAEKIENREMACLILPLDECDLLLPNDCVAEVMPWRRVKPAAGLPRWCPGTLVWRNHTVAVVDFSVLAGLRDQPRMNRRALVVVNRITLREGSALYAFACAGLPRVLRASESELQDAPDSESRQGALAAIQLGSDTAFIPDLRFIEDEVSRAF
jgi:chemosensory pili system protein ChpC